MWGLMVQGAMCMCVMAVILLVMVSDVHMCSRWTAFQS